MIPLRYVLLFLITFFFSLPLIGQTDFQAGMSRINITPEVPIRMSGYGGRDEPYSSVHDSIYATAIVLKQGSQQMALLGADVVGFSHMFVDQVQAMIERQCGIPGGQTLIIAAHNHGGPVTSVYNDDPTATELDYFKVLKARLVTAVAQAQESMQPASIGAGKGHCRMNINRRARHAEGGIWLGRNPSGPCDTEVGMIRIDNLKGQPIGAFLNWPCHATVTGPRNTALSGDWPGAVAEVFQQQTKSLVLVTAGASADINPIYGPNSKFNDVQAIGLILGEEAGKVFAKIKTQVPTQLTMDQINVAAVGKKRSASRMPNVSLVSGEDQIIRMAAFKIGSIAILGISGEVMTEIGMDIKAMSPYKNTFVVTHCNGSNGYLCTDIAYQEGGYEPMVSKTMPGTAEKLREGARHLLHLH